MDVKKIKKYNRERHKIERELFWLQFYGNNEKWFDILKNRIGYFDFLLNKIETLKSL